MSKTTALLNGTNGTTKPETPPLYWWAISDERGPLLAWRCQTEPGARPVLEARDGFTWHQALDALRRTERALGPPVCDYNVFLHFLLRNVEADVMVMAMARKGKLQRLPADLGALEDRVGVHVLPLGLSFSPWPKQPPARGLAGRFLDDLVGYLALGTLGGLLGPAIEWFRWGASESLCRPDYWQMVLALVVPTAVLVAWLGHRSRSQD